jgi:hypothetical protein
LITIKKIYATCVAYEKHTGGGGDGDLHYLRYNCDIPKPTLLEMRGRKIGSARAAGAAVGNLTEEDYLAWTFDEANGVFALLDKQ